MKIKIAIIVPIYNPPSHWEESCLEHMLAFQTLHPEHEAQFILVNDGSEQTIFSRLQTQIQKTTLRCSIFHLSKNYGKGRALRYGISKVQSETDCIVCVDWDFPFGVGIIDEMVRKIVSGEEIILADRGISYLKKLPKTRALITRLWRRFLRSVLQIGLSDTQAGVKAFTVRSAALYGECKIDSFLSDFEFLLRARINKIPVSTLPAELRGDVKLDNFSLRVYLRELRMLLYLLRTFYWHPLKLKLDQRSHIREKKMHVLHADDFGLNKETNRAIKKAILSNVIGSVSVMTNMPETDDALHFLKNHPEVRVGLHFNLTEGGKYRGPASLIMNYLLGKYTLAQFESDLVSQYAVLRASKIKIHHLDSHQHVHAFLPFYQVFLKFAEKHSISQVRGCRISCSALKALLVIRPTLKQSFICLAYITSSMLTKTNKNVSQYIFDLNWHNQFSRKKLKTIFEALESNTEIFCHLSDKITVDEVSKERFACYTFLLSPGFKRFWDKYAKISTD